MLKKHCSPLLLHFPEAWPCSLPTVCLASQNLVTSFHRKFQCGLLRAQDYLQSYINEDKSWWGRASVYKCCHRYNFDGENRGIHTLSVVLLLFRIWFSNPASFSEIYEVSIYMLLYAAIYQISDASPSSGKLSGKVPLTLKTWLLSLWTAALHYSRCILHTIAWGHTFV